MCDLVATSDWELHARVSAEAQGMTTTWSRDEILKLIEVWGDDNIQAQLNGCKRNQDIFDKISSALLEAWFVKSGSQSRDKIKKS